MVAKWLSSVALVSAFLLAWLANSGNRAVAGDEIIVGKLKGSAALDGKRLKEGRIFVHVSKYYFVGALISERGEFGMRAVPVGKHPVTFEFPGCPDRYTSLDR